jgi:hypothetical protein
VLAKKYDQAQKHQCGSPNIAIAESSASALASGNSRGTVRKARFFFRAQVLRALLAAPGGVRYAAGSCQQRPFNGKSWSFFAYV